MRSSRAGLRICNPPIPFASHPPAPDNPAHEPMNLQSLPRAAPRFIPPMLATLVSDLPVGSKWSYELKLDGYRALIVKDVDQIQILSRNHKHLTARFPTVVKAVGSIRAKCAVIDGEVVAVTESGAPSFEALQSQTASTPVAFYAFDLLNLEGRDTRNLALDARRELLGPLVAGTKILLSTELDAPLGTLKTHVRKLGLEGIVAKRRDSLYEAGKRTGAWQKWRANLEGDFVVGGYVPGYGTFESLLVGYYEAGKLLYTGKVRAGFTPAIRRKVFGELATQESPRCRFVNVPETRSSRWGEGLTREQMEKCRWLRPKLVVRIAFLEWTRSQHLRHSRFVAMRPDKPAREAIRER